MMLNSGIYRAITMPPTAAPMTAMRMGSIMLVQELGGANQHPGRQGQGAAEQGSGKVSLWPMRVV
jgi:hypothetical protein